MNNITEMLNYDALNEAEKITGKSYKEDEKTSMLGFILMQEQSKKKKEVLKVTRDSYFGIPAIEFINLMEENGFINVFTDRHIHDHIVDEFHIMINERYHAVMLFDTYWGIKKINGGTIYMAVDFNNDECLRKSFHLGMSSGPMKNYDLGRYVDFDVREGVLHKIYSLMDLGTPIKDYKEKTWFWRTPWWIEENMDSYRIGFKKYIPEEYSRNFDFKD